MRFRSFLSSWRINLLNVNIPTAIDDLEKEMDGLRSKEACDRNAAWVQNKRSIIYAHFYFRSLTFPEDTELMRVGVWFGFAYCVKSLQFLH